MGSKEVNELKYREAFAFIGMSGKNESQEKRAAKRTDKVSLTQIFQMNSIDKKYKQAEEVAAASKYRGTHVSEFKDVADMKPEKAWEDIASHTNKSFDDVEAHAYKAFDVVSDSIPSVWKEIDSY